MDNTVLDLKAIEARCKTLDEHMSDMSELVWTLEGPNHHGLFSVYDSDGNVVSHGIRERQDFIAHARRDVPVLLAEVKQLRELFAVARDWRIRRDTLTSMRNSIHPGLRYQALGIPAQEVGNAEAAFWSILAELEWEEAEGKKNG